MIARGGARARPVLRHQPLAGRHAHQLQDASRARSSACAPSRRWSSDGTFERMTKKEVLGITREREKLEKSLGGIKSMSELPGAVFIVDAEQGAHRGHRGAQARDPDRRDRRHQLRSGPDRLRRSRATTTRSARSSCSPARSPTPAIARPARSAARARRSQRRGARARASGEAADHPRRRRAATGRASRSRRAGAASCRARSGRDARRRSAASAGHSFTRRDPSQRTERMAEITAHDDQGPARAHRRRHGRLQEGARRVRRRHGEGDRVPAQEGPRRRPPRRRAASPPRARSPRTSTAAASACCVEVNCETDFVARNRRLQTLRQATSRCRSPAIEPARTSREDEIPAAVVEKEREIRLEQAEAVGQAARR